MKNFLVGLLVLTALVSCGKKNEVSSSATAIGSNPIIIADASGVQLGSMVDNYPTQFGTAQTYYYGNVETYARLISVGAVLNFKYTKAASTSSTGSNNCEMKWIFYVCSYGSVSGGSTSSTTVSRTVQSNTVDVNSKMAEIKAIINSAKPLVPIRVSGSSYYIISNDGKEYIIDTRYPLQANPIGIKDATSTEYLFNITL